MPKIEQRIERLEQQQTPAHGAVDIFVVSLTAPGRAPVPTSGWNFTNGLKQSQFVMRLHGESDEQLQERAIATARLARPGCVLVFYQVNEGAQP